jgi:UDP-GlcNAc:polypeptide alpha-N-acetylglucosaminyltransferase
VLFEATLRGEARSVVAPSRQIGGGFLLCVASVVRHVPFDPGLDGVHNNEELAYTARLFTHGIDVVAPRQNVVCHRYFYDDHKVVWNDNPAWNADTRGNERADAMLSGRSADLYDAYGMGKVRTLDEFWRHVAINYPAREVTEPWA